MDAGRWQQVETLFHEALTRRGAEREAFVTSACAGDSALEAEVRSLLAREPASDGFLAVPALDDVARIAAAASATGAPGLDLVPDRVAHYRIVRRLGEGGMGVVYEAFDERLERPVALKLLRQDAADPSAGERLTREARVAARVVHPLICQVYDLGNADGRPFIAMELVTGESLADRLARGALAPADALRTAAAILDALAVLHGHGIVHRDLKPSNIFLSPAGVKLLDFGLARPLHAPSDVTGQPLTAAGMFVGTPQYASPEQLTGAAVDARSDLFSAAVVAFEMLAGRPPFTGATLPALAHAVMYDAPPVLTGAAAVAAADRVLHRALAKSPVERYPTAEAFAAGVRAALAMVDSSQPVDTRPILRLAVLPFRSLKPDPETAYLGPSLADALASSLAGLESLVVRSTLKSARYAQSPLDLDHLATDLAVDVVLTGTLLPARGRIRVSAELVAAPSGDVWWSRVIDSAADAVLELHDDLAEQVLAALPVSTRDKRAPRASAANEKAFELYLRGMQLRAEAGAWRQAHAFFVHSLDCDAGFAAAWAERGRIERVLGKFEDPSLLVTAEASLRRALALDPDSGAAQYYLAQLEIDLGRVGDSLARLLDRGWQRRAEPHVFAALVHACRYGGLLDASVAAHHAAVRLDPAVPTSILHTYYHQQAFALALDQLHRSSDPIEARMLGAMGRIADAVPAAVREELRYAAIPLLRAFATAMRAGLEGRADEAREAMRPFDQRQYGDGEMLFYVAEVDALIGDAARAFARLHQAVDNGFLCAAAFDRDTYLAPLRTHPEWAPLMARVEAAQAQVRQVFETHRGPALLGL
jgi:serine/threonine protein kinase/tetratricopeptide (TPR) repeat protein